MDRLQKPKFGINLVDVKDVADMHIEAMLNKNASGKGSYYHLRLCGFQKYLKF